MSYTRIDSAFPPTLAQAQQAKAQGVEEWGGYIPAPRVYHAWTKADFDILRQAGLRPVFISTGSDPLADIPAARACGAQPGDKLTLDVEAGWNDTYSANWAGAVHASGFVSELYGLDSEVNAHGAPFDERWRARYVYPQVPTPAANEAIQYENSFNLDGMTVDKSISNEPLGGLPLTDAEKQDLASALTQLAYAGILHRDPAADPGGVNYWYSQFVANGFGNTMKAIVSGQEAQHDFQVEASETTQPAPAPDALAAEKALKDVEATIHTDLGA